MGRETIQSLRTWAQVDTDHSACTSLLSMPNPSAKLARWEMIVQEMNLQIEHRPSKNNVNADTPS